MVSREEYDYTSKWFFAKFITKTQPLGDEKNAYLSMSDLAGYQSKSNTLVGMIFGEGYDKISKTMEIICETNFGALPNKIIEEFDKQFKKEMKGGTSGPVLARIAPYLLLNNDVLEVIFEFTYNECMIDIELIEEHMIPKFCIMVIFDYGEGKVDRIIEASVYENINKRFIVVNASKFADFLGIDVDFLKQRVLYNVVNTSSVLIGKIRQNANVVEKMDDNTKKWLFKTREPQVSALSKIMKMKTMRNFDES